MSDLVESVSSSASAAHLDVRMRHRQGALEINVAFELTQPWTVLFGPSGSGKSTVLRTIAGLLRPDFGRIVLGGRMLTESDAGVFVRAHERPIRSAGQTAKLFPHLTVRDNVRYGCRGSEGSEEKEIVQEVLNRFELGALAERMPRELSGGEQQRASVARALASATAWKRLGDVLLLLDEPFSGLDLRMRDRVMQELQMWLERWKIPVLSVTHDVGEAFQLGAEVIKIADGRLMQQGPVVEVLTVERDRLLEQLRAGMPVRFQG